MPERVISYYADNILTQLGINKNNYSFDSAIWVSPDNIFELSNCTFNGRSHIEKSTMLLLKYDLTQLGIQTFK